MIEVVGECRAGTRYLHGPAEGSSYGVVRDNGGQVQECKYSDWWYEDYVMEFVLGVALNVVC